MCTPYCYPGRAAYPPLYKKRSRKSGKIYLALQREARSFIAVLFIVGESTVQCRLNAATYLLSEIVLKRRVARARPRQPRAVLATALLVAWATLLHCPVQDAQKVLALREVKDGQELP